MKPTFESSPSGNYADWLGSEPQIELYAAVQSVCCELAKGKEEQLLKQLNLLSKQVQFLSTAVKVQEEIVHSIVCSAPSASTSVDASLQTDFSTGNVNVENAVCQKGLSNFSMGNFEVNPDEPPAHEALFLSVFSLTDNPTPDIVCALACEARVSEEYVRNYFHKLRSSMRTYMQRVQKRLGRSHNQSISDTLFVSAATIEGNLNARAEPDQEWTESSAGDLVGQDPERQQLLSRVSEMLDEKGGLSMSHATGEIILQMSRSQSYEVRGAQLTALAATRQVALVRLMSSKLLNVLDEWLREAEIDRQTTFILQLMECLRKLPISVPMLQASNLPKSLARVSRHRNEEVASAVQLVLQRWQPQSGQSSRPPVPLPVPQRPKRPLESITESPYAAALQQSKLGQGISLPQAGFRQVTISNFSDRATEAEGAKKLARGSQLWVDQGTAVEVDVGHNMKQGTGVSEARQEVGSQGVTAAKTEEAATVQLDDKEKAPRKIPLFFKTFKSAHSTRPLTADEVIRKKKKLKAMQALHSTSTTTGTCQPSADDSKSQAPSSTLPVTTRQPSATPSISAHLDAVALAPKSLATIKPSHTRERPVPTTPQPQPALPWLLQQQLSSLRNHGDPNTGTGPSSLVSAVPEGDHGIAVRHTTEALGADTATIAKEVAQSSSQSIGAAAVTVAAAAGTLAAAGTSSAAAAVATTAAAVGAGQHLLAATGAKPQKLPGFPFLSPKRPAGVSKARHPFSRILPKPVSAAASKGLLNASENIMPGAHSPIKSATTATWVSLHSPSGMDPSPRQRDAYYEALDASRADAKVNVAQSIVGSAQWMALDMAPLEESTTTPSQNDRMHSSFETCSTTGEVRSNQEVQGNTPSVHQQTQNMSVASSIEVASWSVTTTVVNITRGSAVEVEEFVKDGSAAASASVVDVASGDVAEARELHVDGSIATGAASVIRAQPAPSRLSIAQAGAKHLASFVSIMPAFVGASLPQTGVDHTLVERTEASSLEQSTSQDVKKASSSAMKEGALPSGAQLLAEKQCVEAGPATDAAEKEASTRQTQSSRLKVPSALPTALRASLLKKPKEGTTEQGASVNEGPSRVSGQEYEHGIDRHTVQQTSKKVTFVTGPSSGPSQLGISKSEQRSESRKALGTHSIVTTDLVADPMKAERHLLTHTLEPATRKRDTELPSRSKHPLDLPLQSEHSTDLSLRSERSLSPSRASSAREQQPPSRQVSKEQLPAAIAAANQNPNFAAEYLKAALSALLQAKMKQGQGSQVDQKAPQANHSSGPTHPTVPGEHRAAAAETAAEARISASAQATKHPGFSSAQNPSTSSPMEMPVHHASQQSGHLSMAGLQQPAQTMGSQAAAYAPASNHAPHSGGSYLPSHSAAAVLSHSFSHLAGERVPHSFSQPATASQLACGASAQGTRQPSMIAPASSNSASSSYSSAALAAQRLSYASAQVMGQPSTLAASHCAAALTLHSASQSVASVVAHSSSHLAAALGAQQPLHPSAQVMGQPSSSAPLPSPLHHPAALSAQLPVHASAQVKGQPSMSTGSQSAANSASSRGALATSSMGSKPASSSEQTPGSLDHLDRIKAILEGQKRKKEQQQQGQQQQHAHHQQSQLLAKQQELHRVFKNAEEKRAILEQQQQEMAAAAEAYKKKMGTLLVKQMRQQLTKLVNTTETSSRQEGMQPSRTWQTPPLLLGASAIATGEESQEYVVQRQQESKVTRVKYGPVGSSTGPPPSPAEPLASTSQPQASVPKLSWVPVEAEQWQKQNSLLWVGGVRLAAHVIPPASYGSTATSAPAPSEKTNNAVTNHVEQHCPSLPETMAHVTIMKTTRFDDLNHKGHLYQSGLLHQTSVKQGHAYIDVKQTEQ